MTDALSHRGPDGSGYFRAPGIGLGHRRLSIIDPAGGEQPMFNEDGSVALVFNGMIYNFQALRRELQALGHRFANHSDTEVIVHGWEEWGADCVQHLQGMFAFALWDCRHRLLLLARDRIGKKPLYYGVTDDGSLVFASELRSLAACRDLPLQIDPEAVEDYFTFGYIPDPLTIYRRVRRLPAAHSLLIRSGQPVPRPQRYWSLPKPSPAPDESAAITELRRLLDNAVADRLVADVPVGAFLSGGLDSASVVATAARLHARAIDTFTIGFEGADDETPFAEAVAARYGTVQHNERASTVDMIDASARQAALFGEPFGDPSSVPSETVCALARRHATVAISGDGGDEVFAGYRRYRWHRLVESARQYLPPSVRRHAVGTLARLYPKLDRAPQWLRARNTLSELSLDSALGYARTVTKVQSEQRRGLYSAGLASQIDGYDPLARIAALMEEAPGDDPLAQAQYVDIATYLPGDILVKVDRTSMAHSLEVRAPFLDQSIVTWGVALPHPLKLRGKQGKYLLRQAMAADLPATVLSRRKQGFATSQADMFRRNRARVRGRLQSESLRESGLFDCARIDRVLTEHEAGAYDHSHAIWLLLVFEGFLASCPRTR